jgi:predicted NACHT family NTPase
LIEFDKGWSVEKLIPQLRSNPDRQQHLFDTYVDRRLERGVTLEYPKDKVLHWLNFLASRMLQEKQTIFLIEKMQPTWLQNRSEKMAYRIRIFIASGLIGELFVGLIVGLKYGGAACIQHFALRLTLHKKGRSPWNYEKFLDFASDHLLMKKVGGGYVFFHRMLLEHFAQMNQN